MISGITFAGLKHYLEQPKKFVNHTEYQIREEYMIDYYGKPLLRIHEFNYPTHHTIMFLFQDYNEQSMTFDYERSLTNLRVFRTELVVDTTV